MKIHVILNLEDGGRIQRIFKNKADAETYCKRRESDWVEGRSNLIIEEHYIQD